MERRKGAMERKWISREQSEKLTSVWPPMPYTFDGQESDDQEILITQSSSQTSTPRNTSQTVQRGSRKLPSQTSIPVPKKGRKTIFFFNLAKNKGQVMWSQVFKKLKKTCWNLLQGDWNEKKLHAFWLFVWCWPRINWISSDRGLMWVFCLKHY